MEIAFDDEYNQGSSRFKFKLPNSINWTKPKDVYQFKTKEACLNHAKFKGNSFIFAYDSELWRGSDDRAKKIVKVYCHAPNPNSFMKFYKLISSNNRHFYELIYGYHYEFYDIDLKLDEITTAKYSINTVLDWFKQIRKDFILMETVNSTDSPFRKEPNWIISSASTDKKISLHIINTQVVFNYNKDFKEFYRRFISFMNKVSTDKLLVKSVDKAVSSYQTLMRIAGSSKFNDPNRILECMEDSGEFINHLITLNHCDPNMLTNVWVSSIDPLKWLTCESQDKSKNNSKYVEEKYDENIEELLEILSDERASDYSDWFSIGCALKDYPDHVFLNFSKRCASKYDEQACLNILKRARNYSNGPRWSIGSIHLFARHDNPELYENYISKHTKFIPKDCFTHDISVNTKWLPDNFYTNHIQKHDTICIKSNMNTGKTYTLKNLFSDKSTVLFVYSRIALCESKFDELKSHGFKIYNNLGDKRDTLKDSEIVKDLVINSEKYPRVICQIDSLWRVKGKYDIVVLDETEALVEHLVGSPHIKDKNSFNSLMMYSAWCKLLILADANLTDSTVKLFSGGRKSVVKVLNTWTSLMGLKVHLANSKKYIIQKIIDDIGLGKRLVIPTNVKKVAQEIYELLCNRFPDKKFGVMHSDSENISSDSWDQYDAIIYTSKISAGISFEKVHFDKLYGVFTNNTCSVQLCTQMLLRVRKLKDNEMYISVPKNRKHISRSITNEDISEDIRMRVITGIDNKLINGKIMGNVYTNKIIKDDYFKMYLYYKKQRNLSYTFFKTIFTRILKNHGVTVLKIKSDEEIASDTLTSDLKTIGENIKKADLELILQAPDLNPEQVVVINDKPNKTSQDILALKKHRIKTVFEIHDQELTREFLQKNIKVVDGYNNYKQYKDMTLDNVIDMTLKKHTELYDTKLLKDYNEQINGQELSGSDSELTSGDEKHQEYYIEGTKMVFENNFARIQKRNSRIRKKLLGMKSIKSTIYTALNYNPRWLKIKYCSEILKVIGFETLSDTKKLILDWYKLRDYLAKNEKSIRSIFDSNKVVFKDPRIVEEGNEENNERNEEGDDEDDDENIKEKNSKTNTIEKMKQQIMQYINSKLEIVFGINISLSYDRSKKHKINKMFII